MCVLRFDNPAARAPLIVQALTFAWLALYHFWLLVYPASLSCDWTHSSIELIDFSENKFWHDILRTTTIFVTFSLGVLMVLRLFQRALHHKTALAVYRAIPKISKFIIPEKETIGDEDNRRIVHGLALLIIPFIPVSNVFFSTGFVLAERVLYLPSIGFTFLVGLGLQKIVQHFFGCGTVSAPHSQNDETVKFVKDCTLGKHHSEMAPEMLDKIRSGGGRSWSTEMMQLNCIPEYRATVKHTKMALYALFLMVALSGLSLKTFARSLEW